MKTSYILPIILAIAVSFTVKAQDSAKVAKTFTDLLAICKNVDFGDSNTQKLGMFYKAAPFIVYRGEDAKRKWKDVARYNDPREKEEVDNTCLQINGTINQGTEYKIIKYITQKEAEGTWHVLLISYTRKGKEKRAAYAFLKIKERYALGDID